mgnify:FL=1
MVCSAVLAEAFYDNSIIGVWLADMSSVRAEFAGERITAGTNWA